MNVKMTEYKIAEKEQSKKKPSMLLSLVFLLFCGSV